MDLTFEEENKIEKIYGIQRGDRNINIVKFVNHFGKIGGFNEILNRLQDKKVWCSMETVQHYMEALSSIQTIFYIDFAREYIPKIWESVSQNLMNPSELNLRTYEKERLESIVNSIDTLLVRVYSSKQKIHLSEQLSLALSLKCYQSDVLKQRIIGLKLISQVIKYVHMNACKSQYDLELKPRQFAEWIRQNKIIEDLYINDIHSELLNRSSDLFKFALTEKLLTKSLINDIFNAIQRQDKMTKLVFLKLLKDVSCEFCLEEAKLVIDNIKLTEVKDLTVEHIEVVYELANPSIFKPIEIQKDIEMNNETQQETSNVVDALYYFYDLVMTREFSAMCSELKGKILERFSELIRVDQGMRERIIFLGKCIEDIKKNAQVSHLLQMIKQIIGTYKQKEWPELSLNQNQERKGLRLNRVVSEEGESEEQLQNNEEKEIKGTSSKNERLIAPKHKREEAIQTKEYIQSSLVAMLVKEYKLIDQVLDNMRVVKQTSKRRLENTMYTIAERKEILREFRGEIGERIDFIKFINSQLEESEKIISTPLLSEVWRDIVEDPLDIDERDLLFKWLCQLADEKGSIVTEVAAFFKHQLSQNTEFIHNLSFDGFLCYKAMFISLNLQQKLLIPISTAPKKNCTTNAYGDICSLSGGTNANNQQNNNNSGDDDSEFEFTVLIRPQELEGIDLLWEIVYKNNDPKVLQNGIDFLVKLHLNLASSQHIDPKHVRTQFIQHCLTQIHTFNPEDSQRVKRALDILQCLLNESEKKGIGHLKPLNGLVKGEVQSLVITNDLTYVSEGQKKQDIKIVSNKTIIDLKILIASKVNSSWDQIKIVRGSSFKQLRDQDNSKTIGDIRFKNNENLTIERRATPPIPEANLTEADGSLTERAKEIFTSWFQMFSSKDDGLMDANNLAKFIHSCTGDNCREDDQRVSQTLAQWDHQKIGKLTLQDFLEFYKNACADKKSVVWKNLHAYSYRNDLKLLSDVKEEVQDLDILPRNIIMQSEEFYELMLRILENAEVSESVMNLLSRLPASPALVRKVINLEGVRGKDNQEWTTLLDPQNSHHLLYTLIIIEYLMENQETSLHQKAEEHSNPPIIDKETNQDILKTYYSQGTTIDPSHWREEFISCGGFDQLFKVFIHYAEQDYSKLTTNIKKILSFILRIMNNYLTAVLANQVPHLYKINQYAVQVKFSLLSINENLKKAENPPSQKEVEEEEKNNQSNKKDQQSQLESQSEFQEVKQETTESEPQVTPYHPNVLGINQSETITSPPIVGDYSSIDLQKWTERTQLKETNDFLLLRDQLSGSLGKKILDSLDVGSMLERIIDIVLEVVSMETELESEDRVIIDFSWCIIIDILLYDAKQREKLGQGSEKFSSLILKGLFNLNLNVRRVFSHAIYLLSRQDKGTLSSFLLDLLIKNVPNSKDVSRSDCNQFYELLCKIIEESQYIAHVKIDFQSLINQMITNVQTHVSQETRHNSKNDKILIGFLNLCEKILKIEPSLGQNLGEFADYLFNECLFCKNPEEMLQKHLRFEELQKSGIYEFNPPFYVKCKSFDSRRAVYKILISILKSNKSIFNRIVSDGLNALFDTIRTPTSWNYSPSNEQKCHQNYLGIKNLSQICYMNSMLQQFYMTKTFRYALLAADDGIEPNQVEYRGSLIDDNLLHQIQKMFAYLDLSDRQDYNPTGFCFSFKDYQGLPINVGVQQDAHEFLNMIFDKLESSLNATPYKCILESIFGGQTCSQMICSACGNIKSKHELFYTQQLRVEGCKKLSDSFQKMIEGETISEFKCDSCQKKCDQSRRICFSQLPNILIIQLQRIVYDLDTFMNKKINTRLEFPHILDLKEYTVEYLEEMEKKKEKENQTNENGFGDNQNEESETNNLITENDDRTSNQIQGAEQYKLKGITVQQGTAELGHYYSYINYKDDKWLEFNDSRIQEFNPANIESECFGGTSSTSSENYWEKGENSKNAYILVYERVIKKPLKLVTQSEQQLKQVEESLSLHITKQTPDSSKPGQSIAEIDFYSINQQIKYIIFENEGGCLQINFTTLIIPIIFHFINKRRIPIKMFIDTWLDNHSFMLEKHVYSIYFLQFLKDLLNEIEKPTDFSLCKTTEENIYKSFNEIPQDQQKLYHSTLTMCAKLFFNIIYKSSDFEVCFSIHLFIQQYFKQIMKELTVQINYLNDLIPQHTYAFAKEFIFDRFKQVENILTVCSESIVRKAYQEVIVHIFNNIIQYYNISFNIPQNYVNTSILIKIILKNIHFLFRINQYILDFLFEYLNPVFIFELKQFLGKTDEELTESELAERDILTFLDKLLDIMHTEVTKNWIRMQQYLEFWRDFSRGGDAQVKWCFQKEMIARQIDFFLGSASLLDCYCKKKNEIGNRFVATPFGPLIQCVAYLISKVKLPDIPKRQEFSENDSFMLDNQEFYSRAMQENYDSQSICYIGQLMSHQNKCFSESFGRLILRGIIKATTDTIKQYLNLMESFLLINDEITHYRIEWIFGYANLKLNNGGGYEARLNLEDQIVVYETKLKFENIQSVLNIIFHYRKTWENICLHILQRVLYLCKIDHKFLNYVMKLPAPTVTCAHYLSWVRAHLEQIIQEQTKSFSNQKEELASQILILYEEVENIINSFAAQRESENSDQHHHPKDQEQPSVKGLKSLWPNYIIGKIQSEEQIDCMVMAEDESENQVYLREIEYNVLYTDSYPNGLTNLIFPDQIKCNSYIITSAINLPGSNIQDFLYLNQDIPQASIVPKNVSQDHCNDLGFITAAELQTKNFNKLAEENKNFEKEEDDENFGLNIQPKQLNFRTQLANDLEEKFNKPKEENNQNVINDNDVSEKDSTIRILNESRADEDNDSIDSNKAQEGDDGVFSSNGICSFQDEASSSPACFNEQIAEVVEDSNTLIENKDDPIVQKQIDVDEKQEEKEIVKEENYQVQCVRSDVRVRVNISNLVRRFEINNNSNLGAQVRVYFRYEDESTQQNINQYLPYEIYQNIEPNSSVIILSIRKINPLLDWTKYTIRYETSFIPLPNNQDSSNQQKKVQFNLSSNQPIQDIPHDMTSSEDSPSPLKVLPKSDLHCEKEIGPQLPPTSISQSDQQNVSSCLVCTYVQLASNSICEMCESPMY